MIPTILEKIYIYINAGSFKNLDICKYLDSFYLLLKKNKKKRFILPSQKFCKLNCV